MLAENAVKMLALMADISRNAVFPTNELNLHKQNRKQTLLVQHSQPGYLANEEYRKVVFGDTPYAHIGPTVESIDKIDRKALEDFRDTFLVPNNAYLIVVGKLPARARMLKTITDQFGGWEQKEVPAYAAPKPPEPERQVSADRPARISAGGHAAGQTRSDIQRSRLLSPERRIHCRRRRRQLAALPRYPGEARICVRCAHRGRRACRRGQFLRRHPGKE